MPVGNAAAIAEGCRKEITKPGIQLEITEEFMSRSELLFLGSNTVNAFLYDHDTRSGLSSCVDHSMAAGRPIAVTRSGMFRHLHQINPSVCIEDAPLSKIVENGFGPLEHLRDQYLKHNASRQWVAAISEALERRSFSASVPDGRVEQGS